MSATPQFRNLVFEGGGIKGIATIGAMQILRHRGYLDHIVRVGGTSAGAINALIFALGYSIEEQRQILKSTDFRQFMDSSFGFIRDVRRLAYKFGYHKGEFFRGWLGGLIEAKLGSQDATFADLKAKKNAPELYVIGTNLSTGHSEVFSHERHPDMPLLDAIHISMAIPLFFQAVRHGEREDVMVDGGVQMNYPVKLFDRVKYIAEDERCACRYTEYYNKENARFLLDQPGRSPYVYNCQTLGLRLDTQSQIGLFRYNEQLKGKPIKRFSHYAKALLGALMNAQEKQHLKSDDWQRTVYINTLNVGTTDFDISDETKEALIEQGILGAENYLQWFEEQQATPVNRLPEQSTTDY
jgi:NTE family protein